MPDNSTVDHEPQSTQAAPNYLLTGVQDGPPTMAVPASPNHLATSVQEKGPPPTEAVAQFDILATSAGVPNQAVLARAAKLTVPGYELLESVGKGGMGIVYRARQLALERDIALKFLRDDFHPRSSTGLRFLEEAKITAQLQHPGIPAVHEVGTMPDGRPYLAMKLIRGRTLDTMLKEQGPGSTKWLSVFEAICQAVGFAHTHGVIHRDLKPSNVMVGAFGEVQVMDWGLAKVLGRAAIATEGTDEYETPALDSPHFSRSEGSVETRAGSYLGTPAFMAPEQATGDLEKLGPRTDVFGLGAVLCMLLTGKPPYLGGNSETTRLMAAAVKQDEAFARLEECGADPDLIELCKRCLAGEPAGRPADGGVVARQVASLRSYAEERAKQAELDIARTEVAAAGERKRQRVRLQWGIALGLAMLVGTAASTVLFVQANTAKEEAVANEKKAVENEQKAVEEKRISDSTLHFFLDDLLKQADGDVAGRTAKDNPTIRELLDQAAKELTPEKIEKKFPNQPAVQAKILGAVGGTYRGIGQIAPAIAHLKRSVELYLKTLGPKDRETRDAQNQLALAYRENNQLPEAVALFEQLRDLNMEIYANEPNHGNILNSINNLAETYRKVGKEKEAIKLMEAVRLDFQKKGSEFDAQRWIVEDSLAGAYLSVNRIQPAITLFQEVLANRRTGLGKDDPRTILTMINLAEAHRMKEEPADLQECIRLSNLAIDAMTTARGEDHPYTLGAMNNLAKANLTLVKLDVDAGKPVTPEDPRTVKAIELFEQICQRATQTSQRIIDVPAKFAPDHPLLLAYEDLLAEAYLDAKQHDKAIAQYEKVCSRMEKTFGLTDARTRMTMNNLAQAFVKIGKPEMAVPILQQIRELDMKNPAKGTGHSDYVTSTNNLAHALLKCGQDAKALPLMVESAQALVKLQYKHEGSVTVFANLADLYEKQKRYADAEPWRKEMVICAKQEQGIESQYYLGGLVQLGLCQMKQKKWPAAIDNLKVSVAHRVTLQAGKWQLYNTESILGAAYFHNGQMAEAEPLLVEGYEGLRRTAATLPPALADYPKTAGLRLLSYYEATKTHDKEAKELKAKLQ